MQANGQFRMAVRGQPGQRYTVQASSDLSQYSNVHTFIMPNSGLYEFQDTNSSSPRFFRAIKGQ
jgi:hypothetical protein